MEFWGVEVRPGSKKVSCNPGEDTYLHVTQVALGEIINGKEERVVIRVEIDGKQVVLGTLTHGKCDQMNTDLIFDREFKLFHSGTGSSVYVCGYKTDSPREEEFTDEDDDDEDDQDDDTIPEAVPLSRAKPEVVKATVKAAAPIVAEDDDDDMDEDDDEDGEEDGEEEDESSEEEEEPKHESKKRAFPATPTNKVSPAAKKPKGGAETPEVKVKGPVPQPASDGKAGGQKGGKKGPEVGSKDAKDTKSKKSPGKLAGDYKCATCSKVFSSESGLAQHTTAKHSS